jgi:putative FmdB family regulatory protein
MPIYEYECRGCGIRFDRRQSFQDEPIRVCPECGGETRRVFQPAGVIFKGSGWYITDSRKSQSASTGGSGSADKGSSAGKNGDKPADSKPAAESSPAPKTPAE